ncbi:M56 family metallopeptidase [Agriterribacter sp.]|uniref:M56 family metallopeptidase n=1 Tax=Agriterribacter sp. TaxID=2821509 RepID=UPI002BB1A32B|nr:M56 family metallopeptidase [Agriterribacter sp.]HRP56472.1 M56 family metallopeptidase [Agriterribacter sp.]
MDTLASFLIKSIFASGILYLYYQAALRNKKFHSYNRFYLLLSIMISLIIPFINFRWLYIVESQNTPLTTFVSIVNSPAISGPAKLFTTGAVLLCTITFISVLLLFLLASKIMWIYRIKRMNTNTKMRGYTLIETEVNQAPFSFLSNLFWKHGLSATDINGKKILNHELTHIMQYHTYDKLFAQIVFCIFWMNPFYWLIQRELNTIHEFIADAASVENGDTASFAKMLLHSHNDGSYLSPSHSFFNSSIKRRLNMISLSNKTQYSYLRKILALPITLIVLAVLSVSVKAQSDTKTNLQTAKKIQKPIEDTIPKSTSKPSRQNLEPITVIGQKSDKNQSLVPITVIGHKSDKSQSLEPTTVIGHKSDKNPGLEPITVIGHKSDKKQSLEPITVTGQKLSPKNKR